MRFLNVAVLAVLMVSFGPALAEEFTGNLEEALGTYGANVVCLSRNFKREHQHGACTEALRQEDWSDTARAQFYAQRAFTWSREEEYLAVVDFTDAILLSPENQLRAKYLLDRAEVFARSLFFGRDMACQDVKQVLAMFPEHDRGLDNYQDYCKKQF